METRKVAVILAAFMTAVASAADTASKDLEELISEDDGNGKGGKDERGSRRGGRDEKDEKEERGSRSSRDRDEKGGKNGDKDKGGKGDDDHATEKEIVSATRAALKVLEEDEVLAIIKKHGDGAKKATEVEPEFRQDVIDALEEAVEDADKD